MNRWLRLSLVWLVCAVPMRAQDDDRPSHDFGNRTMTPKNISKFLDERRGRAGPGMDTALMKKLVENFGDVIDPAKIDPEVVRKFIEDNPEFRDPKNLERIKELVEKQIRENPDQWDPQKLQDALKRVEDLQLKNKERPDLKKENPPRPEIDDRPKPKQGDNGEPKDDRRLNEMKKWAKKHFGDSPAMQNLAREFTQRLNRAGNRKLDWLPNMKKDWLPSADWLKRRKKNQDNDGFSTTMKLPNLGGNFKLPDGPSPSFSSSSSSSDWGGFSGPGGGPEGGSWLVIVLALGVAGAILWYFLATAKKTVPPPAVELPAPPVDLSNLASREDVILAFEYLSVTKCGSESRNWNHNEIAEKMGALTDVDAASGLASLYEKARYAPANELFTEADLAAARRNVQRLTEGTPA